MTADCRTLWQCELQQSPRPREEATVISVATFVIMSSLRDGIGHSPLFGSSDECIVRACCGQGALRS
jgi:hypothetical protein